MSQSLLANGLYLPCIPMICLASLFCFTASANAFALAKSVSMGHSVKTSLPASMDGRSDPAWRSTRMQLTTRSMSGSLATSAHVSMYRGKIFAGRLTFRCSISFRTAIKAISLDSLGRTGCRTVLQRHELVLRGIQEIWQMSAGRPIRAGRSARWRRIESNQRNFMLCC